MKIGFDVISDLNLNPDDKFNWEGKATSLYCIVAGNISSNTKTIINTLLHLSRYYQGVFYTLGSLEYCDSMNIDDRTDTLLNLCERVPNLAILHHHVVIIDGIAILGCNGWIQCESDTLSKLDMDVHHIEDIKYLKSSVEKLQKHLDVTKIVVVSNSVPEKKLYFGEVPSNIDDHVPLNIVTFADTQNKISHWVFGTHGKIVDTTLDGINYINNPYSKVQPYWAKRIEVLV